MAIYANQTADKASILQGAGTRVHIQQPVTVEVCAIKKLAGDRKW